MTDLNSLPLPELFAELTADGCLDRLLDAAFDEDLHSPGDITSRSIIAAERTACANVVCRQPGVLAGLEILPRLEEEDEGLKTTFVAAINDGDSVRAGAVVASARGELRTILGMERIMLNLVGRLSGIATLTSRYVQAIAGTSAVICDTRKTTPGMRNLEKYAVRCGGGTLHRIGLFDAALFKDNHLAGIPLAQLAARLAQAIGSLRREHELRFVEVEVDTLDQLREVLRIEKGLLDIVLLDNMNESHLREAVALRGSLAPQVLLEASGGVHLANIRGIAETGVDRISVGAITHSAPCLDIGLDIE